MATTPRWERSVRTSASGANAAGEIRRRCRRPAAERGRRAGPGAGFIGLTGAGGGWGGRGGGGWGAGGGGGWGGGGGGGGHGLGEVGGAGYAGLEAAEDHGPGSLHEGGLGGRVDQLVHLDVRALAVRLDSQVAGQLAAGDRHVVVLEVPAQHDELGRADQLVPAAHARSPFHRAGEAAIPE